MVHEPTFEEDEPRQYRPYPAYRSAADSWMPFMSTSGPLPTTSGPMLLASPTTLSASSPDSLEVPTVLPAHPGISPIPSTHFHDSPVHGKNTHFDPCIGSDSQERHFLSLTNNNHCLGDALILPRLFEEIRGVTTSSTAIVLAERVEANHDIEAIARPVKIWLDKQHSQRPSLKARIRTEAMQIARDLWNNVGGQVLT